VTIQQLLKAMIKHLLDHSLMQPLSCDQMKEQFARQRLIDPVNASIFGASNQAGNIVVAGLAASHDWHRSIRQRTSTYNFWDTRLPQTNRPLRN
jgi:hypothetical protein